MRSSWYYLLVEGIEVEVEVEVEVEAEVEVEYTRGEVEVEVCRSRWNGCCVLILIVFCKSLLAIEFKLLRHGCGLNVRICAKQPVFQVSGAALRRKDGSRAPRFRASFCRRICLEARVQCN